MLAGAAASIRERLTATQYPFDRAGLESFMAKGRARLGDGWQAAWDEGFSMSPQEAFELGLPEGR